MTIDPDILEGEVVEHAPKKQATAGDAFHKSFIDLTAILRQGCFILLIFVVFLCALALFLGTFVPLLFIFLIPFGVVAWLSARSQR